MKKASKLNISTTLYIFLDASLLYSTDDTPERENSINCLVVSFAFGGQGQHHERRRPHRPSGGGAARLSLLGDNATQKHSDFSDAMQRYLAGASALQIAATIHLVYVSTNSSTLVTFDQGMATTATLKMCLMFASNNRHAAVLDLVTLPNVKST